MVMFSLSEAVEPGRFGGKASTLSALRARGVRVPDGWVLEASALDEALAHAGAEPSVWSARLDALDERAELAAFDALAKDVHDVLMSLALPPWLEDDLETLDFSEPWVVRSSAIGEDGAAHSFAGQLHSVLGVSSRDACRDAIKTVWASAWSSAALFYQVVHQQALGGVGVLLQPQLKPQSAGVMFTRDPLNGAPEVMIEWVEGLADVLVQGEVNPSRARFALSSPEAQGALDACALPCASQLWSLAHHLERQWGPGQDVEWVLDVAGQVHVVQMRPMTRGVQSNSGGIVDGLETMVWSNANMSENYPDPVSPLLYSIAQCGYQHYFKNLGGAFGVRAKHIDSLETPLSHMIGAHQGRLYYNLSHIHACLLAAPFGETLAADWNGFLGVEESADETVSTKGRAADMMEALEMVIKATRSLLGIQRGIERFEHTVGQFAQTYHHDKHDEMPSDTLLTGFRAFMRIRRVDWVDASLTDALTTISLGALRRVLAQVDQSALLSALLEGIDGLISAAPVRRMWSLAQEIQVHPALVEALRHSPARFFSHRSAYPGVFESFDRYLDEMGFRVSGELMLTTPSLQETPEVVATLLLGYIAADAPNPDAARDESVQRFDNARASLKGALCARYGIVRGGVLWRGVSKVIRVVRLAIALRERARFQQALLYYRLRRLVLSLGGRLVQAGWMQAPEDVFFLTCEEVDDLAGGHALYPSAIRATIEARRQAFDSCAMGSVPRVVRLSAGAYWRFEDAVSEGDESLSEQASSTDDTFSGVVASPGCVRARATSLVSVAEVGKLRRGDVLVTHQTDPGWGPLFYMASGLVLERGGLLSHGAILARELGIPAMVDVPDAVARLDGEVVVLDATRGVLTLVSDAPERG